MKSSHARFAAITVIVFSIWSHHSERAIAMTDPPGDIDLSRKVDHRDFSFVSGQWLTSGSASPSADIAPDPVDGVVDILDLLFMSDHWVDRRKNRVELLYDDFEDGFGNFTDGGVDCFLYTANVDVLPVELQFPYQDQNIMPLTNFAHQGKRAIDIQDNSRSESAFWLTDPIDVDTPGFTEITVEFWFRAESMDDPNEDFWLQYFDGTTWLTVQSWAQRIDFDNGQFYFESVAILESHYTFPTNMQIRFMCDASGDRDDVYIDQVRILAAGGVGVAISNPDPSAIEKSGLPGRWMIQTTGDDVLSVDVHFSVASNEGPHHGPALAGDYELRDAGNNLIVSPLTLAVPTDYAVFVHPVDDGLIEPPERVTLTIDPGSYVVTGIPLDVTIFDADNAPENNTLFVALLRQESTAQTTGSGVATLVINGNNAQALIASSFSGLTTPQTASHIHYAIPSDPVNGIGPPVFDLPLDQFSSLVWDLEANGGYTMTDLIEGLYQLNGLNLYVNVHSANYPAGEIRGALTEQAGSPVFVPPDPPPPHETLTGDDLRRDVARFLMQATFGPKMTEIDALYDDIMNNHGGDRIAGYEAWIDNQFSLDQTSLETLLYYIDENEYFKEGLTRFGGVDFSSPGQTPIWIHWDLALHVHDQLRQRIAFALSEIVVISKIGNNVIGGVHCAPERYWDMLADYADGNYRDVLYDVSKSPLMGFYLSHLANQKAVLDPNTQKVLINPDENFSREIKQLFSIGLLELHPDGSLRLDESGLVLETYDNNDITELARVFTGWGLSKNVNGTENFNFFNIARGPVLNNQRWLHPMKQFPTYHDTGAKNFLGGTVPAGLNGEQDLHAALDIIYDHANVPPFISRLLIQRFTTSNPSQGYIYRVGQVFEDDGLGQRGNLEAVTRAILLDYEARSLVFVDDPNYNNMGKVKEPAISFIQFCRAFNMIPDPNSTDAIADLVALGYPPDQADNFPPNWAVIGKIGQSTSFNFGFQIDQRFMSADSVFNYFLPDFSPGGDIAAAGLVAPELQIATEFTVAARHNEMWRKLYRDDRDWPIDLNQFQQIYDNAINGGATDEQAAEVLVDHLDLLLNAGALKADCLGTPEPNPRSIIIDTVAAQSNNLKTGKALTAPYLILASPAFNTQR